MGHPAMEGRNQMRELSRGGRRVVVGLSALALGLVAFAAVSLAEVVHSNTVFGDSQSATIPSGGSTDVNYWITQNGSICDAADGGAATVTFNLPAGVNASSSSLTFNACAQNESAGAPAVKPVTFSSSTVGTHTITVSVTDPNDATSGPGDEYNENPATFTLTVEPPQNSAPNVGAISGDGTADEGQTKTYSVSASDPDGDPLSYAWSVESGNASINGATNGSSASVDFTDGPSMVKLQVIVSDDHGHSVTKTLDVDEANVAPTVVLSGADSADEGQTKAYTYTVSDPGDDPNPTITESCGSNATKTDTAAGFDCTFIDGLGSSEVKVTADDGDQTNNVGSDKIDVAVANVPPTLSALTLTGANATACSGGNSVGLSFTFSDPAGTNDTYTGSIDWGDGSANSSFGSSPVSASHDYGAGAYTIKVDVHDEDGGNATQKTGSVSLLYNVSGILPPFNANGTSNFKLGSTTPVKIKVLDCDGVSVSDLSPDVSLKKYDPNPDGDVNEVVSSSAADTGNQMRYDPSGQQYIFNLSTKLSGFGIGSPLTPSPGSYEVTAKDASFGSASQKFDLRK
jgi:hypothetical protein